jgi:methyl-accepting chemotaxis protein-like sensor
MSSGPVPPGAASNSGQRETTGAPLGVDAAAEVVGPASRIAEVSSKLSLIGHQIRAATDSQGARMEEVREAIAAVSRNAEALAAHAAESSTIAAETNARARQGADVVARVADDIGNAVRTATEALELIDSLAARVGEVGSFAQAIDQIASRSKLLSINATIEAAHAGEHGRGFAVVAGEFSSLAQSTAEAASAIGEIVSGVKKASEESRGSSDAIRESTRRMDESIAVASDSFVEIVQHVDRLTTINAEVASTSAEQAVVAARLEGTAGAMAVAARTTVASASELGVIIDSVGRSADGLGAATVVAVGGAPARPSATALGTIATKLAPVLELARQEAGRFHALYDEVTARRGGTILREDLASLDAGFHALIRRYGHLLCGVGAVPARDVLADVSLWLQWWTNEPTGPQFLQCDWDPHSPTFYDYPAAEWFREPTARLEPWTAGPFFDEGGTNIHLITISAPVIIDGRAIGVGAADMRVDQIDALCRPALERVGAPTALISRDGRVVSSSDPGWYPAGADLEPELAAWCAASTDHWTVGRSGHTLARIPTLPWALLTVPQR